MKRAERKAGNFLSYTAEINVRRDLYVYTRPLKLHDVALRQRSRHIFYPYFRQIHKVLNKIRSVTLAYGLGDRSSIPGRSRNFVLSAAFNMTAAPAHLPVGHRALFAEVN